MQINGETYVPWDHFQAQMDAANELRERVSSQSAAIRLAVEALEDSRCVGLNVALCIFSPHLGCRRCVALAACREAMGEEMT